MAWSTRELADLAGTSLRSVRHYHDVGLLPEPERRSNGYKQYGVTHLVRLLRIKRLVDLGFSLAQVAELGEHDEHPEEALRALDADLAAQIERLTRLRGELAEILERSLPTDLPPELAAAADRGLAPADRGFVAVMGRTLGPEELRVYAGLLDRDDDGGLEASREFEALPPDADAARRQDLAARLVADVRHLDAEHPGLLELGRDAPAGPAHHMRAVDRALDDLYNAAQVDVIRRLRRLLAASWPNGSGSSTPLPS